MPLTGRRARLSKIGGAMVPHAKPEETINAVLGSPAAVVTAIPDPQRGEKLVAFFAQNVITGDELWIKLNRTDMPKLWIPKRENLHPIDSIPILGSGKADLKKVKAMALERAVR